MKILVAVAPSGELCTLTPVYYRHAADPLANLEGYSIFLENDSYKPVGYAMEHSQGGQMFGTKILEMVEVLGEL